MSCLFTSHMLTLMLNRLHDVESTKGSKASAVEAWGYKENLRYSVRALVHKSIPSHSLNYCTLWPQYNGPSRSNVVPSTRTFEGVEWVVWHWSVVAVYIAALSTPQAIEGQSYS